MSQPTGAPTHQGALDYPRHFRLLGCGAVTLFLLMQLPSVLPFDRFWILCGLSGLLHAIAMVLALRAPASWLSRLAFVIITPALSLAAPVAALQIITLLGLRGIMTIFPALGITSALGAMAYWLLVRRFWLWCLAPWSLLVCVGACVLAVLLASLAISAFPFLRDAMVPMSWWLAFSAVLWSADRYHGHP